MTTSVDVTETAFQSEVIQLAQMMRWRVAHFRPARTAHGWRTAVAADGKGFPDLVLTRRGRLIFAELKSDTGQVAPDQQRWLTVLNLTAAEVYVWRPADLQTIADTLR
jgi:hypothetical protein